MADFCDNVWEPEVWEGVRGRRLVRDHGRPLAGAVWELPPARAPLMIAAHASPDIVEYPDKGEFAAGAHTTQSQRGEPFLVRLPLPDEMFKP